MEVPRILQKTTIRNKRSLMTYVSAFLFMFAFTILAHSIASFLMNRFPETPNAILFVGVILGISSFFGIFVDSLFGYFQKIFPPRNLTIGALVGLILTVGIFFVSDFGSLFSIFRWTVFTFIAAFLYGWSFDLYDITVSNVILKTSAPGKLAQNISQKKVFEALGMVCGLLAASFLVNFGAAITQLSLLIFLVFVLIFFLRHFDRASDADEKLQFSPHLIADWKSVFAHFSDFQKVVNLISGAPEKLKNSILNLIGQTEAALKKLPENSVEVSKKILGNSRKELVEILAREGEIVKKNSRENFDFKKMFAETCQTFSDFFALFGKNFRATIFFAGIGVMIFSFWDTMAITFQPLLLEQFSKEGILPKFLTGALMIIFVAPVFILQIPFSILADKIGREKMLILGLTISGVAVIFLSATHDLKILILCGIASGTGYAAAFSPAQAFFVDEFKKINPTAESEKSAGTLRVALNFGNIFGQFCGGALFAILGFRGGFGFFGVLFLIAAAAGIIFYGKIRPREISPNSPAGNSVNQNPPQKNPAQNSQQKNPPNSNPQNSQQNSSIANSFQKNPAQNSFQKNPVNLNPQKNLQNSSPENSEITDFTQLRNSSAEK